jgi:hypothetical protein
MRDTERNRALVASATLLVAGASLLTIPAIAADPGYAPPGAEDQATTFPGNEHEPGEAPDFGEPGAEVTTAGSNPTGVALRVRKDPLVTYGDEVKLSGRLASKKKGKKVKVTYSEAGKHADQLVEKVKTGKKGKFSLTATPKFTGKYRAEEKKSGRSAPVGVEVKPRFELDV